MIKPATSETLDLKTILVGNIIPFSIDIRIPEKTT